SRPATGDILVFRARRFLPVTPADPTRRFRRRAQRLFAASGLACRLRALQIERGIPSSPWPVTPGDRGDQRLVRRPTWTPPYPATSSAPLASAAAARSPAGERRTPPAPARPPSCP